MQSSNSFEHTRPGRPRPSNLLAGRTSSFELPLPSPSFNVEHAINGMQSRDDYLTGRSASSSSPSKQYHTGAAMLSLSTAVADVSLPPTPVTAGLPLEDAPAPRSAVTLPSINHMLSAAPVRKTILTPPCSGRVPMGPRIGCDDDIAHFEGPRPQWLQDQQQATFTNVRSTTPRQQGPYITGPNTQASTSRLRDVVAAEEEQGTIGLGFVSSEEDVPTPRIGSFGPNALGLYTATTPTQAQMSAGALRAPAIEQQEEGTFPNTVPSSPISPPLRSWNTNLTFYDAGFDPSPPRLSSLPMEREQHVVIEGVMPFQKGLRGLGISLDGSDLVEDEQASSSNSTYVEASPPAMLSRIALDSDFPSTGLTPTLSSARIVDVDDRAGPSTSSALASPTPSLRTKSKKRSELVQREAEAAVSARSQGSSSVSPAHRRSPGSSAVRMSPLPSGVVQEEVAHPSPRKRSLQEVDVEPHPAYSYMSTPSEKKKTSSSRSKSSTSPGANPSSPWGVFRLKEEGWKSLSPPGGGKALGASAVRSSAAALKAGNKPTAVAASLVVAPATKKQRKTGNAAGSAPVSRAISRGQENKENVPPTHAFALSHSAPRREDQQALLGGKFRRPVNTVAGAGSAGETQDVFGSGIGAEHKRPSIPSMGAARRTSVPVSRPTSAPNSGAAPRRRL